MLIDLQATRFMDGHEKNRKVYINIDYIVDVIGCNDEGYEHCSVITFINHRTVIVHGDPEHIAERINNIKSRRYR